MCKNRVLSKKNSKYGERNYSLCQEERGKRPFPMDGVDGGEAICTVGRASGVAEVIWYGVDFVIKIW